ncbi:MAG: TetR/AcrR family transcriptional regulator [Planctomycetota bacterium]|nr:MAG: TetR/AcrR family transcriptional regulator [Planctomycetota bacterium]
MTNTVPARQKGRGRGGARNAKRKRRSGGPSTAEKIFEAAEKLLGEKGYEGTSMRDVAELAGVNKALVFYHFGSKGELFDAVIDRYYKAHRETIERSLSRTYGSTRDRVHRLIDDYLDFMERNRLYPRLIQQEVARRSGRVHQIRRNLVELSRAVGKLLDDLTPEDGPLATRHLFMSVSGMVVNYFTYAPALDELWGGDPMEPARLNERREHIHWMIETILDRLVAEKERRERDAGRQLEASSTS